MTGSYCRFLLFEKGMMPETWLVKMTSKGTLLATVERDPKWKELVLCPGGNTAWSVECLEGVVQFLKAHEKEGKVK